MRRNRARDFNRDYVTSIQAMAEAVTVWITHHPEALPSFALGPKEILIVVALEDIETKVCRNQAAREVCAAVRHAACRLRDHNEPTLPMLDRALETAGISVERVGLGELGMTARSP